MPNAASHRATGARANGKAENRAARHVEELRRRDALLIATAESAAQLLGLGNIERALASVLRIAGIRIGASRAYLFENQRGEDGRARVCKRYEWSASGVTPASSTLVLARLDAEFEGPAPFARLGEGKPISIVASRAEPGFRRLLESLGVLSVLVLPVFVEGEWWGQLGFDDCSVERSWKPMEIRTAETLAGIVGAAIARERRIVALGRRDAILQAVAASATMLLQPLDVTEAIPKVLGLVGESTGASRAYLFEVERANDGQYRPTRHHEWDAPGITPALDHPLLADLDVARSGLDRLLAMLAAGKPVTTRAHDVPGPAGELMLRLGVKSIAAVPVFVDDRWWGVLGFDDCERERPWSAAEVDAATALAAMIGAALARARTLAELADADEVVQSSPSVLLRFKPADGFPLTFISRNVPLVGYTAAELTAKPMLQWTLIHPDDAGRVKTALAGLRSPSAAELNIAFRLRMKSGEYHWIEARLGPKRRADGTLTDIVGVLIDVNERKLSEERLAQISRTDALTGLPNRLEFMERLAQAFASARRKGHQERLHPFAVLYLDIDRFKDVNDTLGHPAGDEVLRAVAERLKSLIRETDTLARLGGDEFAVLQADVMEPSDAAALAAKIVRSLEAPVEVGGKAIHLTASVGIAPYGGPLSNPDEMMKQADQALYRAKDAGRDQYHFHSDNLDSEVRERVALAEELRAALERNQLELYYQPQVELPSHRVVGMEALLRWKHPQRGLLLPSRFIPIAEKSGIMPPLGRWVLEEACRQIRLWHEQGLTPPIIGINLSGAQLRVPREFERDLKRSLRRSSIEPGTLEIELTESVLMETTRERSDAIARLRRLGVRIAIDDFGTGYSSLEYLRVYRVNRLKIAQEFIRDLNDDPNDQAIVRAAISLARELGIEVLAEGVESAEQLAFLAASGCRYVQGFYFSAPVAAEQAGELLRRGVLAPGGPS